MGRVLWVFDAKCFGLAVVWYVISYINVLMVALDAVMIAIFLVSAASSRSIL